jgi:hypothetical protein
MSNQQPNNPLHGITLETILNQLSNTAGLSWERRTDSGGRVTNIYISGDVRDGEIVAGDDDVVENK